MTNLKSIEGNVINKNGMKHHFTGKFAKPAITQPATLTVPKTTTTTTTTTAPKERKKRESKKSTTTTTTTSVTKPKRPATKWTNFTKRVSTIIKSEKKGKGGQNAVSLASALKTARPNDYNKITNEEIKTKLSSWQAPAYVARKTTTTTKKNKPKASVAANVSAANLQPIIFNKIKYYVNESSGATYERINSGATNNNGEPIYTKGKYVGKFTKPDKAKGIKASLNKTAPENKKALTPIENVDETEEENNNYNNENTNNGNNNGNTNSNGYSYNSNVNSEGTTENESNQDGGGALVGADLIYTGQRGGGNDPSCGCDMQAGWLSSSVLPRGGIQGGGKRRRGLAFATRKNKKGGACGCMKGGGCPVPGACPFPGTGYCDFYARGGKYKPTKKNRNAL